APSRPGASRAARRCRCRSPCSPSTPASSGAPEPRPAPSSRTTSRRSPRPTPRRVPRPCRSPPATRRSPPVRSVLSPRAHRSAVQTLAESVVEPLLVRWRILRERRPLLPFGVLELLLHADELALDLLDEAVDRRVEGVAAFARDEVLVIVEVDEHLDLGRLLRSDDDDLDARDLIVVPRQLAGLPLAVLLHPLRHAPVAAGDQDRYLAFVVHRQSSPRSRRGAPRARQHRRQSVEARPLARASGGYSTRSRYNPCAG